MDPQLRARLWWTAVLVLIALPRAGLAVAADGPLDPQQRSELTYRADHEALPLMQSLADDLTEMETLAANLSEIGREKLGRFQAHAGSAPLTRRPVELETTRGEIGAAIAALDLGGEAG